MAISYRAQINMNGSKIVGLGTPSTSTDASTMGYVDTQITGAKARANHTGTQTASTISDFDTQVRTSRLDQMANPTTSVSLNSQKITNLLDPTSAQDAATRNYVDTTLAGFVNGMDWKQSVRAATTGNITLSGTQTIDGVSIIAGDRVLVKDQSTGSQNGIYLCAAGAWTRTTDADASAEVTAGMTVPVAEGTTNADKAFILTTNDPITLATTALTFTQLPGSSSSIPIFESDIGNGSLTTIPLVHNFATRKVAVVVYRNSTPWDTINVEEDRTDTNTVNLIFDGTAPTTAEFHAIVYKLGVG